MALPFAFIGGLGTPELLVIGVIALLLFGSRLPEVGRSLGRGLMEFKKGLSGIKDELDDVDREADRRIDEELDRRRLAETTGAAAPQAEAGASAPGAEAESPAAAPAASPTDPESPAPGTRPSSE
jgi:sec-independent protein translocase protein TatA